MPPIAADHSPSTSCSCGEGQTNWLVIPEGEGTWTTTVQGMDVVVLPLGEVETALRGAARRGRAVPASGPTRRAALRRR